MSTESLLHSKSSLEHGLQTWPTEGVRPVGVEISAVVSRTNLGVGLFENAAQSGW